MVVFIVGARQEYYCRQLIIKGIEDRSNTNNKQMQARRAGQPAAGPHVCVSVCEVSKNSSLKGGFKNNDARKKSATRTFFVK
jgi:hypothetical protein